MKIHCKTRAEFLAVIVHLPVRAYHAVVLHDDACTPANCSCEPEFVIEDLTVENYQRGQRGQRDWIRSKSS